MPLSGEMLNTFVDFLSSNSPTPGGGGASALVGALAAALGNMVGSLTVGKTKYVAVEPQIRVLNRQAETLRAELLALMDADEEAFAPLARAYAIPKDDPAKAEIMEAALLKAVEPPLQIMDKLGEVAELLAEYAAKGSALAVSDAGCGAALCAGAMKAAALNVYINTKSIKDRQEAERLNARVKSVLLRGCALADSVYDEVRRRLSE